jgi:hypothetical protein
MQAVYPARMRVRVLMAVSFRGGCRSAHRVDHRADARVDGGAGAHRHLLLVAVLIRRHSAVGVDAPAGAGAEVRACAHGGPHPLGSMKEPAAARTRVLVLICFSWPVGGWISRRAGRARCPRRRGAVSWCSWDLRSAQGADGGAFARAQPGSGGHLRLLQPWGSMPLPSPARTCVVVFMGAPSAVGVDGAAAAGAEAGRGLHGSCLRMFGGAQPSGSIMDPWPARMRVWLFIVGLREGQPPLGSIMDPWPARMAVLACMAAPRVSRCRRSAGLLRRGCGSDCSWPVSVKSAVGVDAPAQTGAKRGIRLHGGSPG